MKTFGKGFLVGTLTAFSAVAGCVYAFKKTCWINIVVVHCASAVLPIKDNR